MSDESWEEQFKQFLRKTGDDFRRAGEDIKSEAQKLLDAAMDPDKQQRVRGRLKELSSWARKRAEDVAGTVETAASKAARVFHRATDNVIEATEKFSPGRAPSSPKSPRREVVPLRRQAALTASAPKPTRRPEGKPKASRPRREAASQSGRRRARSRGDRKL